MTIRYFWINFNEFYTVLGEAYLSRYYSYTYDNINCIENKSVRTGAMLDLGFRVGYNF